MSTSTQTIGLIAGNGRFPILFARAAKRQRMKVVAAAIRGDTSVLLRPFVDKLSWFKVGELEKLLTFFQGAGIKEIIMAGQVNPNNLFDENVELDGASRKIFEAIQDRKADTIFSAVAGKLKEHDLQLMDSTLLLKDFLAPRGTLTRRGPTVPELEDVHFGRSIAKAMGGIDVGQTVVVKEKAIIAIEAMEGTDQCILRGGEIARRGAVVVKMSKPAQDKRFDVPVIGPRTIAMMVNVRASCLAVEAGRTLVIDRPACVKLANQHDICIVAS